MVNTEHMLNVSSIDPFSTPSAPYISVRVDNVTRELFATLTDILLLSSVPFHLLRSSNARLTTILTSGPRIFDLALYRQCCQFFVRYPYRLLVSKGFSSVESA